MRVPAGHVWLMGDNRDRSADSRFALAAGGLGGPVPWENIGGRAEFITFSPRWVDPVVESVQLVPGLSPGPCRDITQEPWSGQVASPAGINGLSTSGRGRRSSPIRWSAPKFASAGVWIGLVLLVAGIIVLAEPLLLIIGGLIFAVMLDGGVRLLGRVLPWPAVSAG